MRQPSPQETADADIQGVVQNYVAEMSALEKQPRTPERDAQMAQMREDYRALRNYIRDPQSLSDEQLQAILGRQQAAPEVTAEPMAQEAVAPNVENAPTAEVAPVEPSARRVRLAMWTLRARHRLKRRTLSGQAIGKQRLRGTLSSTKH